PKPPFQIARVADIIASRRFASKNVKHPDQKTMVGGTGFEPVTLPARRDALIEPQSSAQSSDATSKTSPAAHGQEHPIFQRTLRYKPPSKDPVRESFLSALSCVPEAAFPDRTCGRYNSVASLRFEERKTPTSKNPGGRYWIRTSDPPGAPGCSHRAAIICSIERRDFQDFTCSSRARASDFSANASV